MDERIGNYHAMTTVVITPKVTKVVTIGKQGPAGSGTPSNVVIADTQMVSNNQYLVNKGAAVCLLTLPLPANTTINDKLIIDGNTLSMGGWQVAQNVGNIIYAAGGAHTTSGVSGSLRSGFAGDSIELRAISTTSWQVVNSEGNPSFN